MAKRIHKLCLIHGYTEAYYQLSEDERAKLWQQVTDVIEKAGAKMSTPYYNCRWSNDKYMTFFITGITLRT
jgi:c-di-AMP phosphodiesterase-like protein